MAARRLPPAPENPAFRVAYVICRAFYLGRCHCGNNGRAPCAAAAQAAAAATKILATDKPQEGM